VRVLTDRLVFSDIFLNFQAPIGGIYRVYRKNRNLPKAVPTKVLQHNFEHFLTKVKTSRVTALRGGGLRTSPRDRVASETLPLKPLPRRIVLPKTV